MARVVVIGAGFGGLAAAVRLAKLGHEVTLLERSGSLGGALSEVPPGRFRLGRGTDVHPAAGGAPRPVPQVRPAAGARARPGAARPGARAPLRGRHLAAGSPAGPARSSWPPSTELGPGLGRQWVDHVASYAEDWDVLRRNYLENPWRPDDLPREVAARLDSREMLAKRLRRTFRDERLRLVAGHPVRRRGPRPAQRAGVARDERLRRAAIRRLDGRRAAWPASVPRSSAGWPPAR